MGTMLVGDLALGPLCVPAGVAERAGPGGAGFGAEPAVVVRLRLDGIGAAGIVTVRVVMMFGGDRCSQYQVRREVLGLCWLGCQQGGDKEQGQEIAHESSLASRGGGFLL